MSLDWSIGEGELEWFCEHGRKGCAEDRVEMAYGLGQPPPHISWRFVEVRGDGNRHTSLCVLVSFLPSCVSAVKGYEVVQSWFVFCETWLTPNSLSGHLTVKHSQRARLPVRAWRKVAPPCLTPTPLSFATSFFQKKGIFAQLLLCSLMLPSIGQS